MPKKVKKLPKLYIGTLLFFTLKVTNACMWASETLG